MKLKSLEIKKTLLISIIIGFVSPLFSQADSTVYKVFKYENGQVSSEGYMVGGKPNFYWKTYHENGILKTEGNRQNFLLDSTWKFYDELANLRYEINYLEGEKSGPYIIYVDSLISSREMYANDLKNGNTTSYYTSGSVKKEIPFLDGIKSGKGYEYSKSGRITSLLTYEKDYLKKIEKINRIDKLDRKQGVWKEFYGDYSIKSEGVYVDGEKYGLFKTYDEEGNVVSVESYRNGVLDSESEESIVLEIKNEYFKGGKVKSSGSYKEGEKHGTHRAYDEGGNIINSYIYEDGVKVAEGIVDANGNFSGPWKLYYLDGKIRATGSYDAGKRIEDWVFFHPNGSKSQKGKYWQGKPTGNWQWYYSNSSIRRDENYRRGYEDGESIEYDSAGEIIGKGEYLDGLKEGPWFVRSGDHTEEGNYIEGERDGDWIHYYDSGKESFKGSYQRGLPVGKHKYYYDSGTLLKEGKYSSGVKQGTWKSYNNAGETILSIDYESGIETRLEGAKIKPSFQELEIE